MKVQTQNPQDEQEKILKSYQDAQRNYVGLNNLGNTCYMNSLLQTLFMTRQFRESLFQRWHYDEKKDPALEDCIPFQLQSLFARLQLFKVKATDAKKLIKSFQWDAHESFMQHDVQEFCRVLFDAIQQSCTPTEEFISRIYESHSESYVKCLNCGHESVRSDRFMDLSLTVKSDFDGVYNESLEKALKHYLKPDKLCDQNLYYCEQCNAKVEALKGLRFTQLGEILTLQLNRFELDLETFERKKVNNWVSYPFILNMNEFLKNFDEISVPDDKDFQEAKKSQENQKFKENQISQNQKRQSNNQDFEEFDDPLRRRKRTNRRPSPDQQIKKQREEDLEEDINKNIAIRDDNKMKQRRLETQSTADDKQPVINKEEQNADLQRSHKELGQKFQSLPKKVQFQTSTTQTNPNLILTADEAYDIENDMFFGTGFVEQAEQWSEMKDFKNPVNQIQTTDDIEDYQKQQNEIVANLFAELEEDSFEQQLQGQVKEYLKNGPYVYELYSVMIHSGGALSGHYYAYIKSFENQRWYCFNDSSVSRIDWKSVQKQFGEPIPTSKSGVSAYFLMYRRVNTLTETTLPQIPEIIEAQSQAEIEEDRLKHIREEEEKRNKALELRLRVFYKEADTIIKCKKTDTLKEFQKQAMELLKVEESIENCRVRFFNFHEKFMQDTFTGREEKTLQELCFNEYKYVMIESKKPSEVFEDFDPHMMLMKVNLWREGIESLDENHLKPALIYIRDDKKVIDAQILIAQKLNLNPEKLIIIRRNMNPLKILSDVLNRPEVNEDIGLVQYRMGNSMNIYVELADNLWVLGNPTKWDLEFESDKFRCTIVFNNPRETPLEGCPQYNLQIHIDSRLTMFEVKERIAEILNLDTNQFIMKKTSRFEHEIKDLSSSIRDNKIIGRGTIFIQFGKPSIQGEYLVKISMGSLSQQKTDSIEFDFEEIGEISISNKLTIKEFKQQICKHFSYLQLDPEYIRIRQKNAVKLVKVYHNEEKLSQIQLFDKQTFVVERTTEPDTSQIGDLLIYVKLFDFEKLELSHPPREIIIKSNSSLPDFAKIVAERFEMRLDSLEAVKINNTFSFSVDDLVLTMMDWLKINEMNFKLSEQPWFVMRDSTFVIIRDKDTIPEDISEFQSQVKQARLQRQLNPIKSTFTGIVNWFKKITKVGETQKRQPIKEKALKITVVKKEQNIPLSETTEKEQLLQQKEQQIENQEQQFTSTENTESEQQT